MRHGREGETRLGSVTRKVKFEYFEVVCKYQEDNDNERDRPFDLRRLLAKANKLSLEARTFDYYQEQARLDSIRYDNDTGYWFLNLARLRATNIPSKASETTTLEPIELEDDEYIGEDVTAIYDEKLNIFMLQRNRYSLSPSGIEEYFNLLFNNDKETIYLRPICLVDPAENAKRALYYRRLNVRFADLPKHKAVAGGSPLKQFIKSFGEYDAISAEVIITVGRTKKNSLNRETVQETIKEIYENKDIITRAELSKKDTDDTNVEVIDLFDHKLHDYLYFTLEERKPLGHEYVADRMSEKYNEKKGYILNCMRKKHTHNS